MAEHSLKLDALTSTTGAEVAGLDPREATDEQIAALRSALSRFGVLVFRGIDMSVQEQIDFAGRFGPSHGHPVSEFLSGVAGHPVSVVENDEKKPSQDDQNFHTDYSFNTVIPDLAVLRPEVIPDRGGDTIWSNVQAAYAGLSDRVKTFLVGVGAVHDAGDAFWFELDRVLGEEAATRARRAFPSVTHPVVSTHPYSGEPLLFVNEGYVRSIAGASPRESKAILGLLFEQINDPSFHYRHRWQQGDVVMWDEHSTVHMGPHDFWPAHRRLTRVTAGSSAPTPRVSAGERSV